MGTNINNCCCTADQATTSNLQNPVKEMRSSANHSYISEPRFKQNSSLNQRAIDMVSSKQYLYKVKKIQQGDLKIQKMEFIVQGNVIELPFTGLKITKGYLSKQSKTK